MKKILISLSLIGIILASGCISEIKSFGAESFPTGEKCSVIGNEAISEGLEKEEIFELKCMELCGNKNRNYVTYKCEMDMLVCYCSAPE